MSNKTKKYQPLKTQEAKSINVLATFVAQAIAIAFLLEPFFMAESSVTRGIMGFAIVWFSLNAAQFAIKYIVRPVARAIQEA